jgi:hypothetical protein
MVHRSRCSTSIAKQPRRFDTVLWPDKSHITKESSSSTGCSQWASRSEVISSLLCPSRTRAAHVQKQKRCFAYSATSSLPSSSICTVHAPGKISTPHGVHQEKSARLMVCILAISTVSVISMFSNISHFNHQPYQSHLFDLHDETASALDRTVHVPFRFSEGRLCMCHSRFSKASKL